MFKKYFIESTTSGDVAQVTNKLDLIRRDNKFCKLCKVGKIIVYDDGTEKCDNCDKVNKVTEATSAEQELRGAKVKIKNVRDGKFGTEFDLFRIPENIDELLKDYKYDIKDNTIFVSK